MRSIVLAALLCAATSIHAETVAYSKDNLTVTLTKEACEFMPLEVGLTEAGADAAYTAIIKIGEQEVPGCWGLLASEGKVLLGDILGNAGYLKMSDFKPVTAPVKRGI